MSSNPKSREYDAETHLTPQKDYGCDVVVLNPKGKSRLVQCKLTSKHQFRGHAPITEIVGAKPYYSSEFGFEFEELDVYTNASKFDSDARRTAKASAVNLEGFSKLKSLLKKHNVTDADVYQKSRSHWSPRKGAAS